MSAKEAKARININKLLEEAGWRFFDDASGKANVVLEPNIKLTIANVDSLGENFEKTGNGFIDFLLLDENSYPLIVLEAKSEEKNPLAGKEQARRYAKSQNCRFVILSNGNLHYFWDLQQGNPHLITRFPAPDSIKGYNRFQPNPDKLATEPIGKDYIVLTQMPAYASEAGWKNDAERPAFLEKNRLRFMREYQLRAVHSIQQAVKEGGNRFLFEMATGTGKTLTAAAVIKLFLRTGNARRVLFLVDRLELEDQANKAFILRYSLLDGVKDGFLVNPLVVDARTDITTQLLSDEGYSVMAVTEDGEDAEQTFYQKDFEKKFFSDATNKVFCETFLKHALRDPISNEIGKTIVFSVSQHHAAKLTQTLNELADVMFPGRYQSDFAVQVTSTIPDAQQFTINFSDKSNNLMGSENFIPGYKTCKARVCVTVGMMTTGYDCEDILNLALIRPIFSPSDFVQIKGRGTRLHNFLDQLHDNELKELVKNPRKGRFKLFDFFANCEYFEEKFDYDEVVHLPAANLSSTASITSTMSTSTYTNTSPDFLAWNEETAIGLDGMKVDRMFFNRFEEEVKEDKVLKGQVEAEQWDQAVDHLVNNLFDKPREYYNLEKLRKAAGVDRRLSLREILEKAFGFIPYFKSKDELLEDEFQKFLLDCHPNEAWQIVAMKYYFKAYATDGHLRQILENRRLTDLNVNPTFGMADFKAVPKEWRSRIPEYIKDYVPLNRFM